MTTEVEPILECPHCGSREAPRVHKVGGGGGPLVYEVMCARWPAPIGGCGASASIEATEAEAIAAWNLRVSPWRPISEYDKETAELVDLWVDGPGRPHSIPRCYWNFVQGAWVSLGSAGESTPQRSIEPTHFMRLPDGPRTAK